MSTRSNIAIIEANGQVKSIYCHWDGYPENNGKLLLEHYNTEEKVKALIALGGLSSLRERLAPKKGEEHSYKKSVKDVTVAYHRDRAEPLEITNFKSLKDFENKIDYIDAAYVYVWHKGAWSYSYVEIVKDKKDKSKAKIHLQPLTHEVCENEKST